MKAARRSAVRRAAPVTAVLAVIASTLPGAARAQPAATTLTGGAQATPAVRDVTLSADSIGIGDRFELRFTVVVPEGAVAFLPDSLEAGAFESFGPVEWTASETAAGDCELSVSYPLIAFRTGSVPVPELDVFVAPAVESVSAGLSTSGDVVGSWQAFRESPADVPSARLLAISEQRILVSSVLVLDDLTTQLAPRPAADVSGRDRDWPSTALATLFGIILAAVTVVSARDWLRAERASGHGSPPDPRTRALAALDALMAEAPHHHGGVREFYGAWSDVVRRYVEGFAPEWTPSWTSTELMSDLQGVRRSLAVRRALAADGVAEEMRLAERVKFGGLRPDVDVAEAHWRAVRDWIAASEPDDRGAPAPEDAP